MHRGSLNFSCGGGRRCRRGLFLLLSAAVAAILLLPHFPAAVAAAIRLPARLDATLATHIMPQYEARLSALAEENAALHTALAAAAPLQAENEALRTLTNNPHFDGARRYLPCTVVGRLPGTMTLQGNGLTSEHAGAAVLDRYGRFAGVLLTVHDTGEATAALAGTADCRVICTVADPGCHGVLTRDGGDWYLEGLPRHSGAAAEAVVSTLSGCPAGLWVGRLAEAPVPDRSGLTARARLVETAAENPDICFAVPE